MNQNGTDISIFTPPEHGKIMREEYPELREYEEFNKLPDYHLRFVWYFANPTSPFIDLSEPDKAVKATELAFQDGVSESERKKFIRCRFDPEVRAAIKIMSGFNPTVRLRAKINAAHILKTVEKLIYVDEDDLLKMTMSERKGYVELSIKVMNEMSGMISIMERGFGVVGSAGEKKYKEPEEEKLGPVEEKIKTID